MSINSIINNSLTGLFTNQSALRTISSNIANINTPGYARQVVQQESIVNGGEVGGVKISGVLRIVDKFLVKSVYNANADTAQYNIENAFHSRIQSLLGRPDQNNSLSGRIDGVFNAISEMALNPLSTILKEGTISKINQFGEEIGTLVDQIQNMRMDASNQIAEKVERINTLTKQIEGLNPLITKETLTNGEPGALIEKRAQALTELSSIIDMNIVDTGNNGIQIATKSGITLLGASRSVLQYSPPGVVSSSTPFSSITVHQTDSISGALRPSNLRLDSGLSSGELKGLLTLRDQDLPEIAMQLGSLAAGFADALNEIHNLNTAVPAPNSLTGINTGLSVSDSHHFTGEAVFAVTDANGDLVSKVNIDFGAIGPTIGDVITAVNAGLNPINGTLNLFNGVLNFSATTGTHGVSISQVSGNESSRGGRGFSHFFGMNNLVEAKVPSHFDTGVAAADAHGFALGGLMQLEVNDINGETLASYGLTIGGASFGDILNDLNASSLGLFVTFSFSSTGELIATPTGAAGGTVKLHVKADSTSRGATNISLSSFFGIGETYKMDAATDLKVRKVINDNANNLALAQFDQTAIVGGNALSVGDQTGALALQGLASQIHKFSKAGDLGEVSVTLAQYSANLLANLGLRSALAKSNMEDSQALSEELNRKSTDISGVNLDEELGNMVIFQNAYSASARLLNTAKEMFDDILQIL
ncbi:MAG: flagellar hook-associated protein FlgK [Emcibacter sp.]|nr:flagellar hook-associated protein FlgK [Emcibacter sp.]